MKKKNLVPLIVFLLSMCLVGFIVYKTDTHEKWQRRTTAQLNVSTYGERIMLILYLIFDYPHKHYTFKYFEV